jgi:NADH:ubiquinone oxidoreductase subunit 2 (subunit N)
VAFRVGVASAISPWAGGLGVEPLVSKGLWIQYDTIFGMVALDSLAVFFKIILLIAVILVGWISLDYYEFKDTPLGTYASLLLIATVGMLFLVGSVDFLCAIISLEILSISSFVLSGFILSRRSSSEGAIKFLLVGTLSTAIFLLGYFHKFCSCLSRELRENNSDAITLCYQRHPQISITDRLLYGFHLAFIKGADFEGVTVYAYTC